MTFKKATTIDEQISILRNRGLIISDIDKAKEILQDIGYYRLGFYLFPFEEYYPKLKTRNHIYKEGSYLDYAIALYYLDLDLRQILSKYLNRIEVSIKTTIIYNLSNKYKDCPTWFADKNIVDEPYISSFYDKVYKRLEKNDIIKRHHKHYRKDVFAPAWKTIEFMTFGEINTLYTNLLFIDDKLLISKKFNIYKTKVFESYIDAVRVLRNACAHGSAIFDLRLSTSISKGPAFYVDGTNGYSLDAVLSVVEYLLSSISKNRVRDMKNEIQNAIQKAEKTYPNVKSLVKTHFSE